MEVLQRPDLPRRGSQCGGELAHSRLVILHSRQCGTEETPACRDTVRVTLLTVAPYVGGGRRRIWAPDCRRLRETMLSRECLGRVSGDDHRRPASPTWKTTAPRGASDCVSGDVAQAYDGGLDERGQTGTEALQRRSRRRASVGRPRRRTGQPWTRAPEGRISMRPSLKRRGGRRRDSRRRRPAGIPAPRDGRGDPKAEAQVSGQRASSRGETPMAFLAPKEKGQ